MDGSKESVDVVQAMALMDGRRTYVSSVRGSNRLTFSLDGAYNGLSTLSMKKSTSHYRGKIYCVSVDTGMIVVRRGGFACVCGNTVNAAGYTAAAGKTVTRSKGKNITYGIMYGAQKHKVAKMLDISPERGQAVIDAYWDNNPGLKAAKEKLERYWESTGKKYILGLDGRKIYTRSKHSLLNALFQSTGAILMDYSGALVNSRAEEAGLEFQRWGFYHDEYQYYVPYTNDKAIFTWHIQDEKDEPAPDNRIWTKPHAATSGKYEGKYIRYYHMLGEISVKSHIDVGRQFGMLIELGAEYMLGRSWAATH